MNRHSLETVWYKCTQNFDILGLVLKTRTKLRIVDKSMFMYNEYGVFIRIQVTLHYYRLLQVTTGYHIFLQITTGY